jgi:glucokinase
VCDVPGSLEYQIGNYSIAGRGRGRFATTHDLIAACRAGDAFAKEVWQRSLRALAVAIGGFTNLFDPEAVIIGGGIAQAGDELFAPLKELVPQFEWRVSGHAVRLLAAQLGEFAGAYGTVSPVVG